MTEFGRFGPDGLLDPIGDDVDEHRRRFLRVAALSAAALFLTGCSPGERQKKPEFEVNPSWQQDFTTMPDGSLDPNQWRISRGPDNSVGGGDQVYTDHPENVAVRNGALVITALQQTIEGHPFTSARIDTLGHTDFGYGRTVIRAKMPNGVGPHAAGWMKRVTKGNDRTYGEIDIYEHVGVNGTRVYNNVHTQATVDGKQGGLIANNKGIDVPQCSNEFVDYGVERTPQGIIFTINGKQVGERISPRSGGHDQWPFGVDDKFYLIFDIAVGDNWGGKSGIDTKSDPWQMEVEKIQFFPLAAR